MSPTEFESQVKAALPRYPWILSVFQASSKKRGLELGLGMYTEGLSIAWLAGTWHLAVTDPHSLSFEYFYGESLEEVLKLLKEAVHVIR